MELRTFIPRVCTFWNTATPVCTAGAAAPSAVVLAFERTACERQRVWIAGRAVAVAGRAAARERPRIDEVSVLVVDAADRMVWSMLDILGACVRVISDGGRGAGAGVGAVRRRRRSRDKN
jgi:hypothetical protein